MRFRGLLSICFVLTLALTGCGKKDEEENVGKPVVNVKIAAADEKDLEIKVSAPATVYAREQANIAARITAPIRELGARKGQSVSANEVLVRLDNRDLIAQRNEAAAAVTDAEATLAKLSAGTLPSEIERARGEVQKTEAALNQAQKNYDRRSQLFDQGAIPQKDLLATQTELSQAKANHDVAVRTFELLQTQSQGRDIQIAQSRVEQAKNRASFLETQLGFAEIRSPFAGTITEQFQFPGDMAKPDAPVFTLADLSLAIGRAQVPETDAGAVRLGQKCSLTPADQPDQSFAGRITTINEAVDPARRTVEVWCEIPNPNRALRAGVFGNLSVLTATVSNAVVVPVSAVQFEEGTRKGFVMVIGKDNKAAKKDIEAGPTVGNLVAIKTGLQKGDVVIVEGGYGLPEGTDVKVAESQKK
jgi:multidrug efflux pump subunit AcrA (membrane-fusion protein)